jgi:hypothetical protein
MYSIPDPENIENIADWVEYYVSKEDDELSKSELGSFIDQAVGSESPEHFLDSVWLEMERRELLYGDLPPYHVNNGTVSSNISWEEFPEYLACVIFSLEGNPVDSLKSGVLFERITNEAVRTFLKGESMTVGFPNNMKVADIASRIGEKYICDPPWYTKDRKLDVVAWRSFKDKRPNQIILLVQCAAGHDWTSKKTELCLDAWCKYVHFASTPIRGFAIPVIISDQVRFEEDSSDAGIIFDRARIYKNIINDPPQDTTLRNDLRQWCEKRIKDMTS